MPPFQPGHSPGGKGNTWQAQATNKHVGYNTSKEGWGGSKGSPSTKQQMGPPQVINKRKFEGGDSPAAKKPTTSMSPVVTANKASTPTASVKSGSAPPTPTPTKASNPATSTPISKQNTTTSTPAASPIVPQLKTLSEQDQKLKDLQVLVVKQEQELKEKCLSQEEALKRLRAKQLKDSSEVDSNLMKNYNAEIATEQQLLSRIGLRLGFVRMEA